MRTLSKGNLQRVAVLQAILHAPKLAILDEPMSGLDPIGRKEMRDLIKDLKQQGTTVLFSSHVLSDAETLCDRVAILKEGRLCEVVSLSDTPGTPSAFTLTLVNPPPRLLERLQSFSPKQVDGAPLRWTLALPDQAAVQQALAEVQRNNATIEALTPQRPSLEERFLNYVPMGSCE
jgi:ABC-2 type transport system ATP-binding protein